MLQLTIITGKSFTRKSVKKSNNSDGSTMFFVLNELIGLDLFCLEYTALGIEPLVKVVSAPKLDDIQCRLLFNVLASDAYYEKNSLLFAMRQYRCFIV